MLNGSCLKTLKLFFVASLSLSACQLDFKKDQKSSSESLSYDFTLNGCATGKHTFSSKDEYCKGLTNESLNKSCALQLRKDLYEQKCGHWPQATGEEWSKVDPSSLDIAVRRILDKRLTGNVVAHGGAYFAFALTVRSDGKYKFEMVRGLDQNIDPSKGSSVESAWSAEGINIDLLGTGKAGAGTFNQAAGVSLTAGILGETDKISVILWDK